MAPWSRTRCYVSGDGAYGDLVMEKQKMAVALLVLFTLLVVGFMVAIK